MPSNVLLKALGLNFSPNSLDLPEGSLLEANNVIIRRDNVVESRRGFKIYGNTLSSSSDRAKQLLTYKGRIIRHYSNLLEFDDGAGNFTAFAGNYSEVQSGLRIKGLETSGNFFFTTSDGIKKISSPTAAGLSDAVVTQAGGVKGIDFTATVNSSPGDQSSFFTQDSAVAYRVVWGIKDANENLILGAPSQRVEVYNPMLTLMLGDYSRLLESLDDINNGVCLISDGNYVNSLKLTVDAAASDLRTNLITLVSKIDNDILYANDSGIGAPLTISSAAIAGTTCTVTFSSGTATNYFVVGSKVYLSNFTPATGTLNGAQVLTNVTATTIEFTTAATGAVSVTAATINSNEYRSITQPAAPSTPTVHSELVEIQNYIQNIIVRLQSEPNAVIPTALKNTYIDTLDLTTTSTVILNIQIPEDITTDYFYQIYRSSVTLSESGTVLLSDIFPNDELQQVYEAYPTDAEIAAGDLTIEDIVPDSFRGANLYTNAASGEGILQANDVPPLAKDINKFKEYTFYANTKTKHRKLISLLGVTNMLTDYNAGNTPTVTIATSDISHTYSFIAGEYEITDLTCVADVADSLNGKYFNLNSANDNDLYYVWYKTSGGAVSDPAVSGRTGIRVDITTGSTATQVAEKTRDILAGYIQQFQTSSSTNILTITNVDLGYTTDLDVATSGFSKVVTTQGQGEKASQEISEFTCVADVAGSLAGTYFTINSAFDKNPYYVWYKVTGVGVDPAIANKTGFQVNLLTNDSASTVAQKTAAAINASLSSKFTAENLSSVLTITNYQYGPAANSTIGTSGFTLVIKEEGALNVLLSEVVSPAKAVDETARSFIRIMNKNKTEIIYGFYLSGVQEVPGKMNLEARALENVTFYLLGNNNNTGESFNPIISPVSTVTSISTGTASTMIITTSSNHNLVTGDEIIVDGSNSLPTIDGIHTVTVLNSTQIRIPVDIFIAGTKGALSKLSRTESSQNESKGNRIYYSKYQQAEAVPIVNYFDVGSEDKEILRIFPLRDSLFVYKEDGLYRVSGESAPFSKALFDSSAILVAPDSLSVANNQLYCWTTQGICTTSESGVSIISRSIDTDVLKLSSSEYTNFKTLTWGIGYESDNSYLVFTNTNPEDTIAMVAYRYSNTTNSWTTFDKTNTCGVVNNNDDKLYLGAGDVSFLEQERKSFSRYDYADREVSLDLVANKYFGTSIKLLNITNVNVGDVLLQDQTLTTYEFNLLLEKLDLDAFLADTNYASSLKTTGGDNLYTKLDSLISKVAADTGRIAQPGALASSAYTSLIPTTSTFAALKTNYNAFIALLNSDPGVGFQNYRLNDNNTIQETVILDINKITKTITVNAALEYIIGPMTVYNAIQTNYTYSPQTLGDPLGLKQMREATMMFANKAFTKAKLIFSSDLLPVEEEIEFNGDGSGIFGHQSFGSNYFGGGSNGAPFRTYIPRNKQRCRYLVIKFSHKIAREQYAVYGISLTGEIGQSTRGYR